MIDKPWEEYQRLRNMVEEVLQSWNILPTKNKGLVTRQAMAEMILEKIKDELK